MIDEYPCKDCLVTSVCRDDCDKLREFCNNIDWSLHEMKNIKNNICPFCGSTITDGICDSCPDMFYDTTRGTRLN